MSQKKEETKKIDYEKVTGLVPKPVKVELFKMALDKGEDVQDIIGDLVIKEVAKKKK